METALHLLAMTGARRGEVAGLRWVDVDLDTARVTIRQALLSVGGDVYVSSPKSHRGRMIDLDERTTALLRRHLEAQKNRGASYLVETAALATCSAGETDPGSILDHSYRRSAG